MSIIYEALKKAEKNIHTAAEIKKNKEAKPARSKPNPYLVFLLAACLTLYIANSIFGFVIRSKKTAPMVEPPQESLPPSNPIPPAAAGTEIKKDQPPPTPALVLNGIFYSQNEGCALINNRIVKVGDVVAGATVKGINLNDVELESEGKIIKLTNP